MMKLLLSLVNFGIPTHLYSLYEFFWWKFLLVVLWLHIGMRFDAKANFIG